MTMDLEAERLIDELRGKIEHADWSERVRIFDELTRGYCRDCGADTHGRVCDCQNDD